MQVLPCNCAASAFVRACVHLAPKIGISVWQEKRNPSPVERSWAERITYRDPKTYHSPDLLVQDPIIALYAAKARAAREDVIPTSLYVYMPASVSQDNACPLSNGSCYEPEFFVFGRVTAQRRVSRTFSDHSHSVSLDFSSSTPSATIMLEVARSEHGPFLRQVPEGKEGPLLTSQHSKTVFAAFREAIDQHLTEWLSPTSKTIYQVARRSEGDDV